MNNSILLAEDEQSIAESIMLNLILDGYHVELAKNGREAMTIFDQATDNFSLIILDVMMPFVSGLDVCEYVKKKNPGVPVMLLTAKSETEDRVRGLKTGADDYLVKPFDLEELLLRVKNLIRIYSREKPSSVFEFSGNYIDFNSWVANSFSGNNIQLTKREFLLLKLLADRKNEVVSRDEILERVWESDESPSSRTIDNMILLFRKHFEKNPKEPVHFLSMRGVGYKLSI